MLEECCRKLTCAASFVPSCSRVSCGMSSSCCSPGAVQASGRGHKDRSCSCVMLASWYMLSKVTSWGCGRSAKLVKLLDSPVSWATCRVTHIV